MSSITQNYPKLLQSNDIDFWKLIFLKDLKMPVVAHPKIGVGSNREVGELVVVRVFCDSAPFEKGLGLFHIGGGQKDIRHQFSRSW